MAKYKISFSDNVIPINQIDDKQRKKIQKLYEDAVKDVNKQIQNLQLLEKQNASTKLQIYRLNQLKDSLNENLKEVTREVEKEIKANMQSISEMTIEKYAEYLGNQQISLKVSYAHISNDIINNITSGNLYKDQYGADWNFSKRIWGDYNSAKGELASIVTNGMLSGKSCYDIAKDLEKYVDPKSQKSWEWSKVYPGTRKKIDYNAQRLARTMISHAYQQSLVEMSKNNPFASGIEWRSALIEHRTCELCEQRHGQIFPVNELPLDHPNGLCTYLMVFNKSKKEIADDLINWVNGEENPELDKYATYLTGEDFSKLSKQQKISKINISEKSKEQIEQKPEKQEKEIKIFSTAQEADAEFRNKIAEIWNNLSDDEKAILYNYTKDSDWANMPLRGYEGKWNNFVGREKTQNQNKEKIDILTNIISKSSYDKDYVLRRDVRLDGLANFVGEKFNWMYSASEEELKEKLLGRELTDYGFMSCSASEKKGLVNVSGLPSKVACDMQVVCPAGTHMIYCEPFAAQGGGNSTYYGYFSEIESKYSERTQLWNGTAKQDYIGAEQEMLIQRETSYVITDISIDDYKKIHIKIEVSAQKY